MKKFNSFYILLLMLCVTAVFGWVPPISAADTTFLQKFPDLSMISATKTIQSSIYTYANDDLKTSPINPTNGYNLYGKSLFIPRGEGGLKVTQLIEYPDLDDITVADSVAVAGTDVFANDTYFYILVYYSTTHGMTSLYDGTVLSHTVTTGTSAMEIKLTGIPVPTDNKITAKYLYRSIREDSGGTITGSFYYIASIALATTYYEDSTPDTELTTNTYVTSTTYNADKYTDVYIAYENANQVISKNPTGTNGNFYYFGDRDTITADGDLTTITGILVAQKGAVCITRKNLKSDTFEVASGYGFFLSNIYNHSFNDQIYVVQPQAMLGTAGSCALTSTSSDTDYLGGAGTRYYKTVHYSRALNIFSTESSETYVTTTADTGYITLSSIDTTANAFVDERWILRTTAGDSTHFFVLAILTSETTAYIDQTDDDDLTVYGNEYEERIPILQGRTGVCVNKSNVLNRNGIKMYMPGTKFYADNDESALNGYLYKVSN